VQQRCSNPSECAERPRKASPQKYDYLQEILKLQKTLENRLASLIRKRSLVRVQAGPHRESPYLWANPGTRTNVRNRLRPFLTPT
jgi:hypothetical protein